MGILPLALVVFFFFWNRSFLTPTRRKAFFFIIGVVLAISLNFGNARTHNPYDARFRIFNLTVYEKISGVNCDPVIDSQSPRSNDGRPYAGCEIDGPMRVQYYAAPPFLIYSPEYFAPTSDSKRVIMRLFPGADLWILPLSLLGFLLSWWLLACILESIYFSLKNTKLFIKEK